MDNKKEKRIEKIYSRNKVKFPKINNWVINKDSKINDKQKKNIVKVLKILSVLFIALCVVNLILEAVEPIMNQQCIEIAKSIATRVSNEEATNVMAEYKYEDLCKTTIDKDYNIKMVNMDMITVNKIISDIPVLIQERLQEEDTNKFNVKLRQFYR